MGHLPVETWMQRRDRLRDEQWAAFPVGARVRVLKHERLGAPSWKGRAGVVVGRNCVEGVYVQLDMTPRERTQKVALFLPGDVLEHVTEASGDDAPPASRRSSETG